MGSPVPFPVSRPARLLPALFSHNDLAFRARITAGRISPIHMLNAVAELAPAGTASRRLRRLLHETGKADVDPQCWHH